jgi:flagellar motor switch/type III secretory pathway protein FliN
MALTLSNGEHLIQQIEQWLGCGLSLQPATIMPASVLTMKFSRNNDGDEKIISNLILGIQDSVLGKLTEPPADQINSASLETGHVPVQIVLSHFHLPIDQYESIEQGRILLIPDSYEQDWWIKLLVPTHESMTRSGVLNRDIRTLTINNKRMTNENDPNSSIQNTDNNGDQKSLRVIIRNAVQIPFDRILGWQGENTVLLDQSLRHHKADIWCESDRIASGHLMSVADGFGVYIDSQ